MPRSYPAVTRRQVLDRSCGDEGAAVSVTFGMSEAKLQKMAGPGRVDRGEIAGTS